MNIHFLSLVCPQFDEDILDLWIDHYLACQFDSYTVFLHNPDDNHAESMGLAVSKLTKKGVTVSQITGKFEGGRLRADTFRPLVQSFDKNDFVVASDSDEIQEIDPKFYRTLLEEFDLLEGVLIDRWDDSLHACISHMNLHYQYPHKGMLQEKLFSQVARIPTKILACKADIQVDYTGSHNTVDIYNREKLPWISGMYEVSHYRWRESTLWRMVHREYDSYEDMLALCKQFNVSLDHPALLMKKGLTEIYNDIKKLSSVNLPPSGFGIFKPMVDPMKKFEKNVRKVNLFDLDEGLRAKHGSDIEIERKGRDLSLHFPLHKVM